MLKNKHRSKVAMEHVETIREHIGPCVYFLCSGDHRFVKIGFTTNIRQRLKSILTGSPESSFLMGTIIGARADEKALHRRFVHLRNSGEWFWLTSEMYGFIGKELISDRVILRNKWSCFQA